MSATDFKDKDGNLVKHVADGSNAVFQQTGEKQDLHYEFKGYNGNGTETVDGKPITGKDEVNLTSAIQEQQNLNNENPDLKPIEKGPTYCNRGTQNLMKTVGSAIGKDITISGNANTMADNIATNPNYKSATEAEAQKTAKNGSLAIMAFRNYNKNEDGTYQSGHMATYSVGSNISKGEVANIGRKSGFKPAVNGTNATFTHTDWSSVKFYILK